MAQTLDQQNEALAAAGVTKVFSDLMSGARDDRPGLAALLEYVREGDTVVVWELDRLGRNMLHILQTAKELTGRGVILLSTSDGIDSSTALGRMMIGVVGSLTECKRELTTERTAPKREASKRNEQSSVGRGEWGDAAQVSDWRTRFGAESILHRAITAVGATRRDPAPLYPSDRAA